MRYFSFIFFLFSIAGFYAQSRTINKVKEDFAAAKFAEGLARLNGLSKDPDEQTLLYYYKAVYFSASTNPNYHLDSAYACVARSEELFLTITEKARTEFCTDFLICMPRFANLKDSLSNEIYSDLVRKKDLAGLQKFVNAYPNAKVLSLAQQKIEELQFERATVANDLLLLDEFLKTYPQSKYKAQINAQREKLRYDQALKVNALASYQQFLADFPNAANKQDILNRLELLVLNNAKAANSVTIYQDFLAQFPTSKYKSEVEGLIYNLRFDAVSEQKDIAAIEKLLLDFPKGPKNTELLEILDDLYYNKAQAEPTIENLEVYCEKYKNNTARYSELFQKLEQLHYEKAVVAATKDTWLEFIAQFPNSNYLPQAKIALAELFTIVPYLNADGRMEFRDLQTQTPQFNKTFDYASPFEDGRAIVGDNGHFGLIDEQGKYLITPQYDQIEKAFESKLIIASKLKTGLAIYWQQTTDEIYNDEWSADEIAALKNFLSTQTTYEADDQPSLQAYRRYLGALISKNYYSYSDFDYYAEDSEKFRNIREKAQEEFNLMEYTLYLFAKGPFSIKIVESCEVLEGSTYFNMDFPYFSYELNEQIYYVGWQNGQFIDLGTEAKRIMFSSADLKIVREGFLETEEAFEPGNFYLQTNGGVRISKQDYNAMEPLGSKGEYFLCHQGGTYEQYKGWMWEIYGGKWGVINKAGQVILPLIFDELHAVDSFDVNPYLVATINKVYPSEYNDYKETLGSVGLLDLQGKELIPYTDGYNMIDFYNRNTIVVTKNAVMGYYANGTTDGSVTLGGTKGVLELNRKMILPVEYNEISPINNGAQFVVRKGMKLIASKEFPDEYTPVGGKYSLVNRNNQYLIPTPIDYLNTDLVGCIGCSVSTFDEAFNGKWGAITETGKTAVPFTYSDTYSSPLAGVFIVNSGQIYKKTEYGFEETTTGKYGLLRNGTLMTAIKYDEIYVNNEYIIAEIGKQKDFFQPNCQPLPFKCDDISDVVGQAEGNTALLAYRIGAKWGLMNTKFEKITEANFWGVIKDETNEHPFTYDNGLFLVDQGGLKFYITRKGVVLKEGL